MSSVMQQLNARSIARLIDLLLPQSLSLSLSLSGFRSFIYLCVYIYIYNRVNTDGEVLKSFQYDEDALLSINRDKYVN